MYQSDIYDYLKSENYDKLMICKDDQEAKVIYDIANVLGYKAFMLPDIRSNVGDDLRSYGEEIQNFFTHMYGYSMESGKKLLISPIRTALLPFPKDKYFDSFKIEFAQNIDVNSFKDKLYSWGYVFTDITHSKGEVSFRGDIIDIFPINQEHPLRVSLFDDEVEGIHNYDPATQKRFGDELEESIVMSAYLALDDKEYNDLKTRVEVSKYDTFVKDIHSLGLWHLDDLATTSLEKYSSIFSSNIEKEISEIYDLDTPMLPQSSLSLDVVPTTTSYRDLEVVNPNKLLETHKNKKIQVIAKSQSIIRGSDLESFDNLEFLYQDGIVNIVGDDILIISLNKPIKRKRVKKASIILDELNVGDYVVHENYGVGLFKGIEKRDVMGATSEFVVLNYQSEDALLIPVSSLEVIDRYVANGGALPILDKLGKASFKRLKEKVKDKLFAIASQIINLSAQRHLKKGIKVRIDKEEHTLFVSQAGFIHTDDQMKSITDMLDDLKSGKMMDRLLSADVGFGKTEVAMNGMYAIVKSGYQSMMIAPTTLLSSQHYKSLKERFAQHNITVAKLDRFSTAKEKRLTLEGLQNGSIDVVVGTHALLKAKFKNLALVIIDEEHKFGVKQKEALKEIAIDVHLLSMSATPIPRSLNLALSQVKSFSEILTPPTERQGVRTFVKSFDDSVVKEVILRELRRGGQVFYVFNSIAGIESKKEELLAILPNLRVTVFHSKVSAKDTEDEMMLFENGEYDVLLSTSIVESGIHMPHANTMIVEGADNFGIADLHQLRGRVGRGDKEGYCYFLVPNKDILTENSKKRLIALESHSSLGSGAVLAFHDLEIRGGGNIIGEAQSGHIKQIGYSLYLRMLEDAIKELSGEDKEVAHNIDMKLSVDAYLNEDLISEDRLRLELYRRLSLCESKAEVYEISVEIEDRFGKLDTPTRQFIDIIVMKVFAKQKSISKVSSYGEKVFIEFIDSSKERVVLQSRSKDDDDIIETAMSYLKG